MDMAANQVMIPLVWATAAEGRVSEQYQLAISSILSFGGRIHNMKQGSIQVRQGVKGICEPVTRYLVEWLAPMGFNTLNGVQVLYILVGVLHSNAGCRLGYYCRTSISIDGALGICSLSRGEQ